MGSRSSVCGHLVGLAQCTVCHIVNETNTAIVKIGFLVGESLNKTVKGFVKNWRISQCVGAIDGSHNPVKPRSMNHAD